MAFRTRRTRRRVSSVRRRTMVRRRNYRRRGARRSRAIAARPRSLGMLMPDRLRMKLPYSVVAAQITGGVGVTRFEYVMSGNSLYDPDVTSTGHQPLLYDQLSAFYKSYYVAACKLKVRTYATGNNADSGARFYCQKNTSGATLAAYTESEIAENTRSSGMLVMPFNSQSGNNWLKYYGTTKAMLTTPGRTSYSAFGATGNVGTGSSPIDRWYFQMIWFSIDNSDWPTASTLWYEMKLTYYCEFSERIMNVGSS